MGLNGSMVTTANMMILPNTSTISSIINTSTPWVSKSSSKVLLMPWDKYLVTSTCHKWEPSTQSKALSATIMTNSHQPMYLRKGSWEWLAPEVTSSKNMRAKPGWIQEMSSNAKTVDNIDTNGFLRSIATLAINSTALTVCKFKRKH